MDREKLMQLKSWVCERLEKLEKDDLEKAADIEAAKNLASLCEKLCILLDNDNGYSRSGGSWEAAGHYDGGHSYRHDYSGARHYVRGHYSRDDGRRRMTEQIDDMMRRGDLSPSDYSTLERARDLLDC